MIERLIHWDHEVFRFLNGMHNDFWDFVMYWISDKYIWIPLYAFFIFLLAKAYKSRIWIILIFVALTITISDQISVHWFKEVFQRLRPCHEPALADMVHIVKGKCGGKYSFVSSHAVNTFALAFFLIQLLGRRIKMFVPLIIIWASIIGYSRVYLGVHYPGDVIAGALVGMLVGYIMGKLCMIFLKYPRKKQPADQ